MFTVITRTSGRPNFFADCRKSVVDQVTNDHYNIFHLVGCDDTKSKYPEGDAIMWLPPRRGRESNLHFNEMIGYVPDTNPWIIFLDDDDVFTYPESLLILWANMKCDFQCNEFEDFLYLWKMRRLDHTIPRVMPPPAGIEFGNITGGAVCFHKKHWINWDNQAGADYRFIHALSQKLKIVWIDEVLTTMQDGPGGGLRQDKKICLDDSE